MPDTPESELSPLDKVKAEVAKYKADVDSLSEDNATLRATVKQLQEDKITAAVDSFAAWSGFPKEFFDGRPENYIQGAIDGVTYYTKEVKKGGDSEETTPKVTAQPADAPIARAGADSMDVSNYYWDPAAGKMVQRGGGQ